MLNETTQVHLKSGIKETTSPIIYTGDYLLITHKSVSDLGGETATVTTETIPIHLSDIKKIVTHKNSKRYPQS